MIFRKRDPKIRMPLYSHKEQARPSKVIKLTQFRNLNSAKKQRKRNQVKTLSSLLPSPISCTGSYEDEAM